MTDPALTPIHRKPLPVGDQRTLDFQLDYVYMVMNSEELYFKDLLQPFYDKLESIAEKAGKDPKQLCWVHDLDAEPKEFKKGGPN